jgi:hypothetical protein
MLAKINETRRGKRGGGKMKTIAKKERRLNPRINQNLPLNVMANGYDFATSTYNVSCLGTYCHIEKYVPPFTKVKIKLNIPLVNNGMRENCLVDCYGVIVRTDDDPAGGFNVAIFFNEIKNPSRQKLSQYVSQCLPQAACSMN